MDYILQIEKKAPKTEGHGSKNERNGGWNKEEKRETQTGENSHPTDVWSDSLRNPMG